MILIIDKLPRTGKTLARALVPALVVALALTACDPGADSTDERPLIVATTSIIGDIAAGVVGDEGTVEVLIPVGVDAHDFQPSARQAARVAEADLVVAGGLGLEHGLDDLLESAAADGIPVLELASSLDPLPLPGGGQDPHFWMDPIRVGRAAELMATRLSEIADGGWDDRARAYSAAMVEVDDEVAANLDVVPDDDRRMVTNHESFGYFADRYGFEIVGVIIPGGSTQAEPSSAEIAALVEVMRQEGVSAIFAETTQPTALADAVASELGGEVEVVELYTESLGEEGSGGETLAEMLVTNSIRIASALGEDG